MSGFTESVVMHSAAVADANGTVLDCSGLPAVAMQASGTLTAVTFYPEGTVDGTNWIALQATSVATGATATSFTAAGVYVVNCAGLSQVRGRLDWTAGSADLVARGVAVGATAWQVTAGGYTVTPSGSITRPNNATPYVAGQVVGTAATHVITFPNCARIAGGSGTIFGADLLDSANQATKAALELWLFTVAPAAQADQAAFAITDAELANRCGIVQFNNWFVGLATVGAGGNAVSLATLANPIGFDCPASITDLYGVLICRNAYTPVALEVFAPMLRVSQD